MQMLQHAVSNRYVLIFLGGAVGSVLRYSLGAWVQRLGGSGFPWNTLAINVLGSFLIGLLLRFSAEGTLSQEARLLLAVGFCGGFTTFSTLSWETLTLAQSSQWLLALLYGQSSLWLGALAAFAGYWLAGRLVA
ncbi:CrcB protein [Allomeiothermus silvanus DSM 9946]|uniref:Fluoride-specific ion channel FluC n=1 Tax=Allomeiothermus silvanus (strain ATCC 700542 / DSM 9946 / NBRC 106475 / NCIMB 13440 / VI-R2) TaxID=526227 RepID=D7BCB6_ALLS1|nr:fluoride efflux transporter CrcB [Allomeiothermus silvanus]ADH64613.1 CrcB protein [Allomeiothermus silvanus DSM 9946]